MKSDPGFAKAARDHVKDTGPSGKTGHHGTDGSSPWARIKRYTRINGGAAENCQYGKSNPRKVIMQLAIDDGVRSRGHRNNIMNSRYRVTGINTGYHRRFKQQTVITYGG